MSTTVKDIAAGMLLAIIIYLLVRNGEQTQKVITALTGGIADNVKALQGRD
jgi:hypothetical protein